MLFVASQVLYDPAASSLHLNGTESLKQYVVIAIDQRCQTYVVGFMDSSCREEEAKPSKAYHDILGSDHESYQAPPKQLLRNDPMASH